MDALITHNIEAIRSVCRKNRVRTLDVFGSAAIDSLRAESDVDLLVSFDGMQPEEYADSYFNTAEELENLFNRPVDLITDKSLGNPFFIASVEKTRVRIYG